MNGQLPSSDRDRLPTRSERVASGRDRLDDLIWAWTQAGGLTELPADYFSAPAEHWHSVESDDPFRVLLLDPASPDVAQPIVDRHAALLRGGWEEKIGNLETGNRDAIVRRYGGVDHSPTRVRAHGAAVSRAYEQLKTVELRRAEIARRTRVADDRREAAVLQVLVPLLADGELNGREVEHLYQACAVIAKDDVARIVLRRLESDGFRPESVAAAAQPSDQLLTGAPWRTDAVKAAAVVAAPEAAALAAVEGPRRSRAVPALIAIGVAGFIGYQLLRTAPASNPVQPPVPEPPAITVTTNPPDCTVLLDGVVLGKTNSIGQAVVKAVVPGTHRLGIQHPGYVSVTRSIQMQHEALAVDVTLAAEPVSSNSDVGNQTGTPSAVTEDPGSRPTDGGTSTPRADSGPVAAPAGGTPVGASQGPVQMSNGGATKVAGEGASTQAQNAGLMGSGTAGAQATGSGSTAPGSSGPLQGSGGAAGTTYAAPGASGTSGDRTSLGTTGRSTAGSGSDAAITGGDGKTGDSVGRINSGATPKRADVSKDLPVMHDHGGLWHSFVFSRLYLAADRLIFLSQSSAGDSFVASWADVSQPIQVFLSSLHTPGFTDQPAMQVKVKLRDENGRERGSRNFNFFSNSAKVIQTTSSGQYVQCPDCTRVSADYVRQVAIARDSGIRYVLSHAAGAAPMLDGRSFFGSSADSSGDHGLQINFTQVGLQVTADIDGANNKDQSRITGALTGTLANDMLTFTITINQIVNGAPCQITWSGRANVSQDALNGGYAGPKGCGPAAKDGRFVLVGWGRWR